MNQPANYSMATGIEAVAWGLLDGGVKFTTAYPGFHAHEIAVLLGCQSFSVNERNAMSIAWGASLAGVRTAAVFKNVGLNDAADPFLNACVLGVNGGMVIVVLDDWDLEQSQCRQDSRFYSNVSACLWLEPYSVTHAYDLARTAPVLSEQLQVPIVLRMTNLLCHAQAKVLRKGIAADPGRLFVRDPQKWVVHPVNAGKHVEWTRQRSGNIQKWVDNAYPQPSKFESDEMTLAMGMAAEFHGSKENIDLMLYTLPLPKPWTARMAESSMRLRVLEHGSNFVAEKIAAARGGLNVSSHSGMASQSKKNYRVSSKYERLYQSLRRNEQRVVVGDLGEHTMDYKKTIDACLCYGSSLGVATGLACAGKELSVFCVTGDAAFMHSGVASLEEAVARKAPVIVIILDNGGCKSTGGQLIPGNVTYSTPQVSWENLTFQDVVTGKFSDMLHGDKTTGRLAPRVIRVQMPF